MLVSIIVLKVVPAFSDFYESFNAQLPLMTRVIVRISEFVRGELLAAPDCGWSRRRGALCLGEAAGQQARLDRWLLSVPMLGDVARKFATSQMARTLSTLLGGGLPLVNALDIAARSVGNRFIASELDVVGARVREGSSFAGGARGAACVSGRRRENGGGRRSQPAPFRTCSIPSLTFTTRRSPPTWSGSSR